MGRRSEDRAFEIRVTVSDIAHVKMEEEWGEGVEREMGRGRGGRGEGVVGRDGRRRGA